MSLLPEQHLDPFSCFRMTQARYRRHDRHTTLRDHQPQYSASHAFDAPYKWTGYLQTAVIPVTCCLLKVTATSCLIGSDGTKVNFCWNSSVLWRFTSTWPLLHVTVTSTSPIPASDVSTAAEYFTTNLTKTSLHQWSLRSHTNNRKLGTMTVHYRKNLIAVQLPLVQTVVFCALCVAFSL